MKVYKKWRDLKTNPLEIKFNNFTIKEIISYPPCGNDVVECIALFKDLEKNIFIKIERSKMASFQLEVDNINILTNNNYYKKLPTNIEDGNVNDLKYVVLDRVEGNRLSDILLEVKEKDLKEKYLETYGKELAIIHQIPPKLFNEARQRPINDYPNIEKKEYFDETILLYYDYLVNNKPTIKFDTFIHGDFHYGNIMWEDEKINGVLDWEYSGKGFKEQDIAWACILRSTQHFMDIVDDIKTFLKGYKKIGTFDKEKLKWCLINGYCHFYLMNRDNEEYKTKLRNLLIEVNNYKFM